MKITSIEITSNSKQGPGMLTDLRWIEDNYGLEGTFSYAGQFLNFEQYFSFFEDTLTGASLSIAAVLVVILFITASLSTTIVVALCVLLVDLYLLAVIFYWGLTFNSIVVVNICIAIGLSVDYSAHIAHTYMNVDAPKHLTKLSDIRKYKAGKALSQMGSSVFHGGFSTFLSIVALAPSKSYIFEVFFKCWFTIIFFGMANGFFLLPVIMSYVGTTTRVNEHNDSDNQTEESQPGDGKQNTTGQRSNQFETPSNDSGLISPDKMRLRDNTGSQVKQKVQIIELSEMELE